MDKSRPIISEKGWERANEGAKSGGEAGNSVNAYREVARVEEALRGLERLKLEVAEITVPSIVTDDGAHSVSSLIMDTTVCIVCIEL